MAACCRLDVYLVNRQAQPLVLTPGLSHQSGCPGYDLLVAPAFQETPRLCLVVAGETDVHIVVIAGPLAKEEVDRPAADDEPFRVEGGHPLGRRKDGLETLHAA